MSPVPTWIFAHADKRIRVERPEPTRLIIVSSEDNERELEFQDVAELVAFQTDFEDHLIENGWSLVEFSPERRSGRERRRVPRFTDRRRRRFPPPPLKRP